MWATTALPGSVLPPDWQHLEPSSEPHETFSTIARGFKTGSTMEFTQRLGELAKMAGKETSSRGPFPFGIAWVYFNFRAEARWDLKNWEEFRGVDFIIVDGVLMRRDSPGNVVYGYALCSGQWPRPIALLAGGLFQQSTRPYWKWAEDDPVDRYWVEFAYDWCRDESELPLVLHAPRPVRKE